MTPARKPIRTCHGLEADDGAPDQRWFWTEEWQVAEAEASEAIVAGATTIHYSTEEFLAALAALDVPGVAR